LARTRKGDLARLVKASHKRFEEGKKKLAVDWPVFIQNPFIDAFEELLQTDNVLDLDPFEREEAFLAHLEQMEIPYLSQYGYLFFKTEKDLVWVKLIINGYLEGG